MRVRVQDRRSHHQSGSDQEGKEEVSSSSARDYTRGKNHALAEQEADRNGSLAYRHGYRKGVQERRDHDQLHHLMVSNRAAGL